MVAKTGKKSVGKTKIAFSKPTKRPMFVLAHGAGHYPKGCSHPDLKAWSKQIKSIGDVVDTLKYPKPFNLMANLCSAHVQVIEKAVSKAKQPVVLLGLGMGARVAVHMMSDTPGDDGKQFEIPPAIRKCVHKMVAINYPLLRVGSREVRSKPLLALKKGAPDILFINGPRDPHMDEAKLGALCKKMKVKTTIVRTPSGESEKPGPAFHHVLDAIRRFAC